MSQDDDFDRQLAQVLAKDPADAAPVSRAVLTALVSGAPAPAAQGGWVLASPLPLGVALMGSLLLAGAASYAALPLVAGEDVGILLLLGNLLPGGGGF